MPDTRDDEHRRLDDALLDAITERARYLGQIEPDEVVQAFVIASHVAGLGLAERNASRYVYLTRDSGVGPDAVPAHELDGLAARLVRWLALPEPEDDAL